MTCTESNTKESSSCIRKMTPDGKIVMPEKIESTGESKM
jgi:hypothetical protein